MAPRWLHKPKWTTAADRGGRMRFRIGLRSALVLTILVSLVPCALLLHFTWWRTAAFVSRDLSGVLEQQIAQAVQRAWWSRVLDVQGLVRTVGVGIAGTPESAARERLLAATVAAAPSLSFLVHIPTTGPILAVEAAGPNRPRVYRLAPDGAVIAAFDFNPDTGVMAPARPGSAATELAIVGMPWTQVAAREPTWVDVPRSPRGDLPAVAYVDGRAGVLAGVMNYRRFAALLGEIPVGRSGRSYVLGPDGAIVIASDAAAAPRLAAMDAVALAAGRRIAARGSAELNTPEQTRLEVDGAAYSVGLSPLWFKGWQLAVIIPESEFLGEIDATIKRVAIGLAVLVLTLGAAGLYAARSLVAGPIAAVVDDLAHVERFDFELVPHRRSRLAEIDRLSSAIGRMSAGLADFAKFIPTDLVRSLLADGVRAEPGGSRREITVLFADLAGFTDLAELLGDDVVPVVSRFLDVASAAVEAEGGTVDKFIGDAVMAFWGAPRDADDQALRACRTALAITAAVAALPPLADGRRLAVRIGIQSGPATVGNVGSSTRLNYTALGDTVNIAARLEGANKAYGTTILIGPTTRAAAGEAIVVREIDTVTLQGRTEAIDVYELLALTEVPPSTMPAYILAYAEALTAYRSGDISAARSAIARALAARPTDGPALRLSDACLQLGETGPTDGWRPVTVLGMK